MIGKMKGVGVPALVGLVLSIETFLITANVSVSRNLPITSLLLQRCLLLHQKKEKGCPSVGPLKPAAVVTGQRDMRMTFVDSFFMFLWKLILTLLPLTSFSWMFW